MKVADVLRQLEDLGTEQNRKLFPRHGVTGPMFGVSYANLAKLKKAIRLDHELAAQLWASGHHDARLLATQVADPQAATAGQLDAWARDVGNHVLGDALATLTAQTPLARRCADAWSASKAEFIASTGWSVLGRLAGTDPHLADEDLEASLQAIERGIRKAPNRARYAMLTALIAIGVRNARLEALALDAARRIGPVEIDHGATDCKTPDAVQTILKTAAYRRAREQGAGVSAAVREAKGAAAKPVAGKKAAAAKPAAARKAAAAKPAAKATGAARPAAQKKSALARPAPRSRARS